MRQQPPRISCSSRPVSSATSRTSPRARACWRATTLEHRRHRRRSCIAPSSRHRAAATVRRADPGRTDPYPFGRVPDVSVFAAPTGATTGARRPLSRTDPDDARRSWEDGVDRYQYLLLMLACMARDPLPLELVLGARVYRRPALLVTALVPVVVAFSVWDVVGIWRGHWSYNPLYVTGIELPLRMPLEELVFFLVVPVCGLLTYEAVGRVLRLARALRSRTGTPMPEYTLLAVVAVARHRRARALVRHQSVRAAAVLALDGHRLRLPGDRRRLAHQARAAPIVLYNPEHHLGLRFPWDVPVEDYLFGFAMVASTIILWERAKRSRSRAVERPSQPSPTDEPPPRAARGRQGRGEPVDARHVTSTEVPEAFDEVADRYDLMVGLSPGYRAQLRASADAAPRRRPGRRSGLARIIRARRRPAAPARPRLRLGRIDPRACRGGAPPRDSGARRWPLGCSPCCGARRRRLGRHARRRTHQGLAVVGRLRRRVAPRRSPHQPELAEARAAGGLDGVLAAYLVRNVPDRDAVISAIRDELRPGGVLVVHDYSVGAAGCRPRSGPRCAGPSSSRSAG